MNFNDARAAVTEFTGQPTHSYGWENDDYYHVAIDYQGAIAFDAPDLLVDKHTGEVLEVFGLLGLPPAEDLRKIGDAPDLA